MVRLLAPGKWDLPIIIIRYVITIIIIIFIINIVIIINVIIIDSRLSLNRPPRFCDAMLERLTLYAKSSAEHYR